MVAFREARMLPIQNPTRGDSDCENHLHTSTSAIVVFNLEVLQTPELDVDTARNAYAHLSQTAFFSLTAAGEAIGNVFYLFLDEQEMMSDDVVDALEKLHHVHVSTDRDLTTSLLSEWTRVRGDDYNVVVYVADDEEILEDDAAYEILRQASTVRTIHSLLFGSPCPHTVARCNVMRIQDRLLEPYIHNIERKHPEAFVDWAIVTPAVGFDAEQATE